MVKSTISSTLKPHGKKKGPYEILHYCPAFKPEILELQKYLWGSTTAAHAAYLKWKYDDNPYMENTVIAVALHKNKVVGMRGMMGAKWQVGDPSQTFICPCAADVVIHPDHRNRGLFKEMSLVTLQKLAEIGYLYAFNLSAGKITYMNCLSMGFRGIGSLEVVHRDKKQRTTLRNIGKFIRKIPPIARMAGQTSFASLDKRSQQQKYKVRTNISCERIPRSEAMEKLISRIRKDGRIQHVRDKGYFSWRFQNPLSQYRFLYWGESQLEGYLVLQTSLNQNSGVVNIVDWEATSEQVRSDLLHAAIHWGNFEKLTTFQATLSKGTKRLLQENRFVPVKGKGLLERSRPTVLIRPTQNGGTSSLWRLGETQMLDQANWDIRMIYSDGY